LLIKLILTILGCELVGNLYWVIALIDDNLWCVTLAKVNIKAKKRDRLLFLMLFLRIVSHQNYLLSLGLLRRALLVISKWICLLYVLVY
jgi:type IV secretory pathway TrbD component